jgi:hypothetical protein
MAQVCFDMSRERATDDPVSQKGAEYKADDSVWTYLPIVLSALAICLLLFFFLTPHFEAAETARARSARLWSGNGSDAAKGNRCPTPEEQDLAASLTLCTLLIRVRDRAP